MANDSSLGGVQFPFDLDSQSGVMQLLAAVRASAIEPGEKNELRDLVFSYANGGHDPSAKITIEQKVAAHGIEPLPVAKPAVEEQVVRPVYPFGASRPAPQFTAAAPVVNTAKAVTPEPVPTVVSKKEVAAAPSVPVSAPSTPTPPTPPTQTPITDEQSPFSPHFNETVSPAQNATAPQSSPAAAEPITAETPDVPAAASEPELDEQPKEAPQDSVEVEQNVAPVTPPVNMVAPPEPAAPNTAVPPVMPAAPTSAPPAAAVPPVSADANQSLQRIREIKALVNEKVGNPVNLVDIDNAVGREYMAALLEAMKKVNSGSSTAAAMERLEQALIAVEAAIQKHADHASTPHVAQPEPAASSVSSEASAPIDTRPQSVAAEPISLPADVPANIPVAPMPAPSVTTEVPTVPPTPPVPPPPQPPVSAPVNPPTHTPDVSASSTPSEPLEDEQNSVAIPRPEMSPQRREAEVEEMKKRAAVPSGAPAPIPTRKVDGAIESAWGPTTDTLHPEAAKSAQNTDAKVSSLAQASTKLRTPSELPLASSLETSSVAGDPLFTKEVDNGLDQLLSEWSLFKKSGLFGTGPKGREHPLFKKIKDLQIPLLLAGRFEGATQEVKQSITDYMNGWRYEQGIIYEQGETFEHYLRRVIRHILDLQKSK